MRTTETMIERDATRVLRGVVVGLLTVMVGIAGHVASDGIAPGICPTVAMVAAVSWMAWRLADQRWTTGSMFAAFVLAQVAVHAVATMDHPAGETSTWLLLGSHVVGALLLVALTRHGETAVWTVVEHLGLRAARSFRFDPLAVVGAIATASPAPLLGATSWSSRPSRAPPVF